MACRCADALPGDFRKYSGSAGVAQPCFSAAALKLFHKPMILLGTHGGSHCTSACGSHTSVGWVVPNGVPVCRRTLSSSSVPQAGTSPCTNLSHFMRCSGWGSCILPVTSGNSHRGLARCLRHERRLQANSGPDELMNFSRPAPSALLQRVLGAGRLHWLIVVRSVPPVGRYKSKDVAGDCHSAERERHVRRHQQLAGRRQLPQETDPDSDRLLGVMVESVVP